MDRCLDFRVGWTPLHIGVYLGNFILVPTLFFLCSSSPLPVYNKSVTSSLSLSVCLSVCVCLSLSLSLSLSLCELWVVRNFFIVLLLRDKIIQIWLIIILLYSKDLNTLGVLDLSTPVYTWCTRIYT